MPVLDSYGEVINSEETYKAISDTLKKEKAVLIGWIDEEGTHYDILFTYRPASNLQQIFNVALIGDVLLSANFQGGIRPTDLFVSIMRVGTFGFEINNEDIDWAYYDEKLNVRGSFGATTGQAIADLINGVKKQLKMDD